MAAMKKPSEAVEAAERLARALETPNESDSNGEAPASVTDGLFELSRAARFVGYVIARGQCAELGHAWRKAYSRGFDDGQRCQWCGEREKP